MEIGFTFCNSAFKHDCSKEDVLWAFETKKYDAALDEREFTDVYLLIGFDLNANLLEVMYHETENGEIKVFHAMKCRKAYLQLLGI